MKDYNLDGVFLQRFSLGVSNPSDLSDLDKIAENVRAGAEKHDRVFAIMYDITGHDANTLVDDIKRDWKHLVNDLKITTSPSYLHHKGKPVLAIWGLGFDDRPGKPDDAIKLINYFKGDGTNPVPVTVMGGVPWWWQTLGDWDVVYCMLDVISPWAFTYDNEADADAYMRDHIKPDLIKTREYGNEYMPVIFPGGSWYNLQRQKAPLNGTPRKGGKFFWRQVNNVISAGCTMIYVAMFDEVDEGTAMFKTVSKKADLPVQAQDRLVYLNIDGDNLPSDWYLHLADLAGEILREERHPSRDIPPRR